MGSTGSRSASMKRGQGRVTAMCSLIPQEVQGQPAFESRLGGGQMVADKEITMLEQLRDATMDRLGAAMLMPRFRGVLGAPPWQLRGLFGQPLSHASHGAQHGLGQVRQDMELTNLVGDRP